MKTKNLGTQDDVENSSQKKSSSNFLIPILAVLGLGSIAAWFFFKKKFTFDPKTVTDYRNRSDDQKIAEAKEISHMYALHGQNLDAAGLIKAVQQYFDLEKTMDSHAALIQIETGIAAKDGKGLLYRKENGFYGFLENEQTFISLIR